MQNKTQKQTLSIGISCYPTFGGSGVIASEIGMEMARRGHRVHFISYDFPHRLQCCLENVFFHEVEIKEYPLFDHQPYTLSLASKIVDVSNYEKLDLVHVHYAIPHATSAYLAKQILGPKSPKVITTLHGTDITLVGAERSYLPITRFSIEQSDGVTSPSEYLKEATYEKLSVARSKVIEVIPNFVNTEIFSPGNNENKASLAKLIGRCPIKEHVKLITHVSNFRPVKRIEDVIRVFSIVQQNINSQLILVGDGPERSKAEALCRELGLTNKVCFLGKQASFLPVLRCSDLFLLPSETESFGLAALEAMSCGVPVVASNVGGLPEVIDDGKEGFLAPVGDVEQMAEKALLILMDPILKQAFSDRCRQKALTKYRLEQVVDRYQAYYYELLS